MEKERGIEEDGQDRTSREEYYKWVSDKAWDYVKQEDLRLRALENKSLALTGVLFGLAAICVRYVGLDCNANGVFWFLFCLAVVTTIGTVVSMYLGTRARQWDLPAMKPLIGGKMMGLTSDEDRYHSVADMLVSIAETTRLGVNRIGSITVATQWLGIVSAVLWILAMAMGKVSDSHSTTP